MASNAADIAPLPVITRAQFLDHMRAHWLQGEHVTLLGTTGTGKTRLGKDVANIRRYVVVLAVKKEDEVLETFSKAGYTKIKKWPPWHWENHVILWTKAKKLEPSAVSEQATIITQVLNDVYERGKWAIYIDEAGYMARWLGQGMRIGMLMSQARSSKISIICGVQRPHSTSQLIPLEVLNQATHHIIFKYRDVDEQKAVARAAGISAKNMVYYQENLHVYPGNYTDFLYFGKGQAYHVRNQL